MGIRDTETVLNFQQRIKNARQIVIVGNGGIATELVYEIENCKVIWAIKDKYACNHLFFDEMASRFFTSRLNEDKVSLKKADGDNLTKRKKYSIKSNFSCSFNLSIFSLKILISIKAIHMNNETNSKAYGSALGPDWAQNLEMKGSTEQRSHNVLVENECEIKRIMLKSEYLKEYPNTIDNKDENWPVYIELTNNKLYGCDFIVSATGVRPCVDAFIKNNKVNNILKSKLYKKIKGLATETMIFEFKKTDSKKFGYAFVIKDTR